MRKLKDKPGRLLFRESYEGAPQDVRSMSAIEWNLLQNSVTSRPRGLKACLSVRSCAATVEGGGFMISDTKLGAASDGCGWSTTEKLG